MCGVIGVVTQGSAILEVRNMLPYLQHRGPQAAGAATQDDAGKTYIQKDAGSVEQALPVSSIDALVGHVGIAGTRYTTSGSNGRANAQPLHDVRTGVAIAYNGHLRNRGQLERALALAGMPRQFDTDTEQLLGAFTWHYADARTHADPKVAALYAASRCMDIAVGAFAMVAAIPELGLIACKSPNGTRPLMYGSKAGATAFASESLPLELRGYSNITDLEPGACAIVSPNLALDITQLRSAPQQRCGFEWVYFARAASKIDDIRANAVRTHLGRLHAERYRSLWDDVDVVIPVPRTALPIAAEISAVIGKPLRHAVEKIETTRIFLAENQIEREELAERNFYIYQEDVDGKNVLLVDDSVVRGTNDRIIIHKAKKYGARKTYLAVAWPPFHNRCEWGIDTPTDDELVAHGRTLEEIRALVGADVLTYSTNEDVVNAIGRPDLCMACTGGNPPSSDTAPEPILKPFR